MVNFEAIRDMILRGVVGDEPTVVNVHTEKRIKRKKPKIRYTEFRFTKCGD